MSRKRTLRGWSRVERVIVREYSALAGHTACNGQPASNAALHREAVRFLAASKLLAPHLNDQEVCGLVISSFIEGWREAEAEAPPAGQEPDQHGLGNETTQRG